MPRRLGGPHLGDAGHAPYGWLRGDLRWLVDLLGPTFIARSRPPTPPAGTSTDELCEDATEVMVELLAGRQLSRAALVEEVRARGVPVQDGQAHACLVAYAAMRGVIWPGPDRG